MINFESFINEKLNMSTADVNVENLIQNTIYAQAINIDNQGNENIIADEWVVKDYDKQQFENKFNNLPVYNAQKYTREKVHTKIFVEIDGNPSIYRVTKKTLDIVSKQEDRSKTWIEDYQVLGLIYKNNDIPTNYNNLTVNDFDTKIVDNFDKYNFNETIIDTESKYKLFLGALKFKHFIQKDFNFNIKNVLHYGKKNFLSKLKESEMLFSKLLNIPFGDKDKENTTDVFIFDSEFSNYNDIGKDNVLVIADNNGICYVIKDLNISEIFHGLEGYNENNVSKYKKIINKIIKNNPDAPKFIQLSLKKNEFDAHFGKVKSTLYRLFNILKEHNNSIYNFNDFLLNEGFEWFKNLFNTLKNKFNNTWNWFKKNSKMWFNSFFHKIEKQWIDIKMSDDDFIDELYGDVLLVLNHRRDTTYDSFLKNEKSSLKNQVKDENKFMEDIMNYKTIASKKTNTLVKTIINDHNNFFNTENGNIVDFHKKFATLLSVSLMGSTNLPIYMVFESNTTDESVKSYVLHGYRLDKEMKQVNTMISKAGKTDYPPYAILIINNYIHKGDKNDNTNIVFEYRTAIIFCYSYSSTKELYITFVPRTSSTSKESFEIETKAPKDTGEYVKMIKAKYQEFLKQS